MKKLLKAYGFNSDMQYFERIVQLTNSTDKQDNKAAKVMFKDMPRDYQKSFVKAIYTNWNSGMNVIDKALFFDLL